MHSDEDGDTILDANSPLDRSVMLFPLQVPKSAVQGGRSQFLQLMMLTKMAR